MANRVASPNLFAGTSPNWSLSLLDANATNATGAINDSSLGSVNGPLTDTGTVNAYTVTCTYGTPSAYNNGMTVFFKPTTTNTGASTLTVSPLSSLPITASDGTALGGGELAAGVTIGVVCDGTAFRIFSFQGPSQITSVRLRSFSSVGNANFEVDQRNCGTLVSNPGNGSLPIDRWTCIKTAVANVDWQQMTPSTAAGGGIVVPGTSFAITRSFLRVTNKAVVSSLAAGDYFVIRQTVEGSTFRELSGDVHSLQVLARSSTAPLKFGLAVQDNTGTRSLTHLCQITIANTWTLIQAPNLSAFPAAGAFSTAAGAIGYVLNITLAQGTLASANDTWLSANVSGALGQDNWLANAIGSTVDFAFLQHESGPNASQLMDLPFTGPNGNLEGCQRYFTKSYDYGTKPGSAVSPGATTFFMPAGTAAAWTFCPFKRTLAKAPTVTGYSPATGAINNVRDGSAGTDRAISSVQNPGDAGFGGFGLSTSNASQAIYNFHYTADTGL